MRMRGAGTAPYGWARAALQAALVLVFLCLGSAAQAGKRVALVIGNSLYQYAGELPNPRNDAIDMAAGLKMHGFQVIQGLDLNKAALERKIRDFAVALDGAEVGLFFYAGHGLQVSGQNYIVPIDAQLRTPSALDFEMVRLDLVQRTMEREAPTNILFLDACRDNPLARNLAGAMGTRSANIGRGLAAAESGVGTLISFSTQPGNVALDGTGRNSPFASALVRHMSSSHDDVSAILIAVRNDVMRETQRRQVPWEHSALTGRFYFAPPEASPADVIVAARPSPNVPTRPPASVAARTPANIAGAGAMFPYPIYATWAEAYRRETGVGLTYQSIGSGGGIRQMQARTVVFGATDMPLKGADLQKDGLVQFPTVMGGVVAIVNIDGVKAGDLVLDGATLAKIFLGEIKSWNDVAIQRLNPKLKLPSQAIAVVHRSDGSGTTYYFTHYLSKVSADWRSRVGTNTAVEWPTGMAARGNEGIANTVALTKGSIGYAEYAYARHNQLIFTRLVNKDAKAVAPGTASFMAAASNANWEGTPGFGVILTDSSGADSWPIASATFILMHKQPDDPAAAREALKFFAWAFASGAKLAEELLYVPMPGNVVGAIQRLWATEIKDASGKPLLTTSN
jgi:phosphate transport system substrate-binding protein